MLLHAVLVFIGGFFGVLARYGLSLMVSNAWEPFPLATACVNICGSFLLGFLVAFLARAVEDQSLRLRIRNLIGTGFLGGFTTYSALIVDSVVHANGDFYPASTAARGAGSLWEVPLYVALSIGLGIITAWLGLMLGEHILIDWCRHIAPSRLRHRRISAENVDSDSIARSCTMRGRPIFWRSSKEQP